MSKLLVCGASWQGEIHDLLLDEEKGCILETGRLEGLYKDVPTLDARGLFLLPSLVDAHVHLREPGQEYKEDIASGLNAAAGGGFGQVMAMANTKPVNDNVDITSFMLRRAQECFPEGPRLRPIGALTKNLAGQELTDMAKLAQAGCVAISNDGLPIENTEIMRQGMERAAAAGLTVIDHCEDPYLGKGGVMNEGEISARLGYKGIPTISEAIQVARDILLASYLEIPIHLAHISCRESVELIAQAKAKSIPVTAETCPHYLLWDERRVESYGTLARVNPPLRTWDDVLAVRQAVQEGVLDILVTDHAPHAVEEKDCNTDKAPNGISGLDTALSLTYSLIRGGVLEWSDLPRLWCWKTSEIFHLPVSKLRAGDAADFLLFDTEQYWTASADALLSKGKNTPCLNQELPGRVVAHFLGGKSIFSRL